MGLPDVNILIYAYRAELEAHRICKEWLEATINGTEPFAMSTLILSQVGQVSEAQPDLPDCVGLDCKL